MKRIIMISTALLLLLALAAGCAESDSAIDGGQREDSPANVPGGSPSDSSPETYLPQVIIDGVPYFLCSFPFINDNIPEAQFEGYILSTVPLTQQPTVNGQANFNVEVGAPYARYGVGYAVLWNNVWTLFVTESDLLEGVIPSLNDTEGSEEDDAGSPDPGPDGISVTINTEHYEYINNVTYADISVDHLRISGHPDEEIEERINQALEESAWVDEVSRTEEDVQYHMTCDYTLLAGRYLSARYYLQYYSRTAAHPWRALLCITLDLETGLTVELTEIMTIDDRLLQKLIGGEFDQSDDGDSQIVGIGEGVLEECDYEDFYWQISSFGRFSLMKNSIGFTVEVSHVDGDYWVLAFPYSGVGELLDPRFVELAGVS